MEMCERIRFQRHTGGEILFEFALEEWHRTAKLIAQRQGFFGKDAVGAFRQGRKCAQDGRHLLHKAAHRVRRRGVCMVSHALAPGWRAAVCRRVARRSGSDGRRFGRCPTTPTRNDRRARGGPGAASFGPTLTAWCPVAAGLPIPPGPGTIRSAVRNPAAAALVAATAPGRSKAQIFAPWACACSARRICALSQGSIATTSWLAASAPGSSRSRPDPGRRSPCRAKGTSSRRRRSVAGGAPSRDYNSWCLRVVRPNRPAGYAA